MENAIWKLESQRVFPFGFLADWVPFGLTLWQGNGFNTIAGGWNGDRFKGNFKEESPGSIGHGGG